MPAVSCAVVAEGFVRGSKNGALLVLRVSPGAKKSSVEGVYGHNALKLKVAAPPVDGRANAETQRFLAKLFGLSRSDVLVERGASSRDKVVLLRGLKPGEVAKIIESRIG